MKYTVEIGKTTFPIEDKVINDLDARYTSANQLHIISNLKNYHAVLESIDMVERKVTVSVNGASYQVDIKDEYDDLLHRMGLDVTPEQKMTDVRAPMPGLILDVVVKVGQTVQKGDQLVILEAMKMENVLQAESDGIVKKIEVSKGDTVEKTQVLIEME